MQEERPCFYARWPSTEGRCRPAQSTLLLALSPGQLGGKASRNRRSCSPASAQCPIIALWELFGAARWLLTVCLPKSQPLRLLPLSRWRAPAHPRAGRMAGGSGARVFRVPRSPHQHEGDVPVPLPGHLALAPRAQASRAARPDQLGADESPGPALAPTREEAASMVRGVIRRQNPRQEPDAVGLPVRICAGGGP